MGRSVAVVHRPSLQVPPEDADVTAQRTGIQTMTRVSAFHSTSPMGCEFVEGPPDWLLDQLAATLRNRLDLQLFNFDLVRPKERTALGMGYLRKMSGKRLILCVCQDGPIAKMHPNVCMTATALHKP